MKVAIALAVAALTAACSTPMHTAPERVAAPGHGPSVATLAEAANDVGITEAAVRAPTAPRMRGPKPGYGPR
jgi:hypothetical protein